MRPASDLERDLDYVRAVVDRADRGSMPAAICYLWAAISALGFPLIDLRPAWVPAFWGVAAPLGFVASAWLGWRHGRRVGQQSWREGRAHMLHWGATTVACFLLVPLAARGALPGEAMAQAVLVIIALSYFLAGVHLAPPLRWVGMAMVAGYLASLFLGGPIWTVVGASIALALTATGALAQARRA